MPIIIQGFNALIVKDGLKVKVLGLVIRVSLPLPLPATGRTNIWLLNNNNSNNR